ncbi:MAG: thioredoxin reductase (NADPH) [Candidatus Tokpelaia sp. JSC161]|nr:MAG: thioredoxin reductase (NADPH) [Candidatus Tokpelaia sp. JSC161]
MSIHHTSVLIIGSGPAGCTAGIYLARALLKPLMITGLQVGGQLTITTEVENYPGFLDGVEGQTLMDHMAKQAEKFGMERIHDVVMNVDLSKKPFVVLCDSRNVYTSDTLIIATGAQARWLGLPSEKLYMGSGVSACATCDGFFYRDKDVLVVGGGNSAVEEACYLSHLARSVTLVHRSDRLRAERIAQKRLFACKNVKVIWNHIVDEIIGIDAFFPKRVQGARLKNVTSDEVTTVFADGIFISIGYTPAVSLFERQLDQKDGGYLWTAPSSTATSVPGVFAAGDVTDSVYRQAITAAGQGCMAALEAERFLNLQDC